MPGRLDQARSRHTALARQRMDRLAEHVANGARISDACALMGLTKGETSRTWMNIKRLLGEQAK